MKNKKLGIILGGIIVLGLVVVSGMWIALSPVAKNKDEVSFKIKPGTNKIQIVNNLKSAGLIKSKIATLTYVFFTANNLQAGTYVIDRSSSSIDIIKQISVGDTKEVPATVKITFVEGKRFVDYANLISKNFDIKYEDIIAYGENEDNLKTLINDYWFLDESILDKDIYYPLEGYLAPNTYEFYQNATIDTIIRKLLDQTQNSLEELKESIEKSDYSVHELLTIASIIEKEALNKSDREKVSQVIYYRLNNNISLGMDVTSYYGSQKNMNDELSRDEMVAMLNDKNPYNTRVLSFIGLPASAICNPSLESITASLNPSKTNYQYFIANVETGKVYFMESYEDFLYYKNDLGLGE